MCIRDRFGRLEAVQPASVEYDSIERLRRRDLNLALRVVQRREWWEHLREVLRVVVSLESAATDGGVLVLVHDVVLCADGIALTPQLLVGVARLGKHVEVEDALWIKAV